MKTTQNIRSKTLHPFSKRFLTARSVRALIAVFAMAFGGLCTTSHSQTVWVYSVNIVGCVPDRTIELLTAPLTATQRQMLHAQNFNSLPPTARPVYLHSVAYAIGFAVASNGQVPDSGMIMEHLKSIPSIHEVPAVPPDVAQSVTALLPTIDTTMKSLNALISVQVAGNPSYSQAMFAGAVCGIINTSGRCLDFP